MTIEGKDSSYAETLARVAQLLDDKNVNLRHIESMSTESVREFLNDTIIMISQAMGLTLAKVKAALADIIQISRNARSAFSESFHDGYQSARRVKPYEGR